MAVMEEWPCFHGSCVMVTSSALEVLVTKLALEVLVTRLA